MSNMPSRQSCTTHPPPVRRAGMHVAPARPFQQPARVAALDVQAIDVHMRRVAGIGAVDQPAAIRRQRPPRRGSPRDRRSAAAPARRRRSCRIAGARRRRYPCRTGSPGRGRCSGPSATLSPWKGPLADLAGRQIQGPDLGHPGPVGEVGKLRAVRREFRIGRRLYLEVLLDTVSWLAHCPLRWTDAAPRQGAWQAGRPREPPEFASAAGKNPAMLETAGQSRGSGTPRP